MATFPLTHRHQQEHQHNARLIATLATTTATTALAILTLPGDPWRLRGIPVIGVHGGLGGAIPGTKP